jgi:hypothetical protein
MQSITKAEIERLAALRALKLLNTPPAVAFIFNHLTGAAHRERRT